MSSLLSLTIDNYRSFYSPQTLTFGERDMRAVTGIYGPNAGGKSNIAKALELIRFCLYNSADANWKLPYEPFLLRESAARQPSRFAVRFEQDGRIFQYALAFDDAHIVFEELKEKSEHTDKMKTVFRREANKEMSPSSDKFGFGKRLLAKTRDETLLVTKGREDNNSYANVVFDFFYNVAVDLDDLTDRGALFVELLKDNESLREKTLELLRKCDFAIRDIKIESVPLPEELLASLPIPDEVKRGMELKGGTSFKTVHAIRDDEKSIIGMRELDFWNQESAGTQRFFKTVVPIIAALEQGGIIYLDEFGTSMHPKLIETLVGLFLDEKSENGAHLIFNSHDTSIMRTSLGRDNIILVEKNSREESVVTPLAKRGVREGEAIEKRYREGLYGGIPLVREG
ncbi:MULTISPECIES: AAA family ATPase [Gordonibacter]|uniref:ATP-binding protein n=1 Tax=Gordonibacter faecis TaxID=3047475 RepID=A0ABT7DMR6_9ACTN|nr:MULTISPECIES: ATP-binding protein [unclassified Gordonibacter]MDJ1650816.1 ATP-binding protein [Gordonibacter sp. KGMB12511]HIW77154.1 ATP-binding protein [Candidatus Gordonibacter avicola]